MKSKLTKYSLLSTNDNKSQAVERDRQLTGLWQPPFRITSKVGRAAERKATWVDNVNGRGQPRSQSPFSILLETALGAAAHVSARFQQIPER